MDEYFWFLADEPSDRRVRDAMRRAESAPQSESMRPSQRTRTPSTDRKKRMRRAAAWETIQGHGEERKTDWDGLIKDWGADKDKIRIHRSMTLYPPADLYDKVTDSSVPKHEKAQALIDHLQGSGKGLGRHWSTSEDHAKRVGFAGGWSAIGNNESEKEENQYSLPLSVIVHAHFPERHHIEDDPKVLEEHHVTPWGGSEHYEDEEEVPLKEGAHVNVTGLSWSDRTNPRPSEWTTHRYDTDAEAREKQESEERQRKIDDLHRSRPAEGESLSHGFAVHLPRDVHQRLVDPAVPAEERAHELVKHVKQQGVRWGNRDDPHGGGKALNLYREHGEPVIQGTLSGKTPPGTNAYQVRHGYEGMGPAPIHGVYWHESAPGADVERAPSHKHNFGPGTPHTATVLNTQVERLNKGDQVRTPTGQVAEITGRPRPHETDSGKVYLDTDMGTTLVSRGTDFQVVPRNSQQQELPDIGNFAGGNAGELPGAGRTPGGPGTAHMPGSNPAVSHAACPNCGNTGTLSLKGSQFVCSVCGFQIAAGGSPGGLTFTNWPSGVMPPRKKPGEVPKAHVWASRNATLRDEGNVIARRARQVLDKEDM